MVKLTDCMVSISQMGRQGSNTAMAQVEVQMEAATRRTNLICFKDIFQAYFSGIFFKNKISNIFQRHQENKSDQNIFSRTQTGIFFKATSRTNLTTIFFKDTNRNIFQRHQEDESDQNICQERTEDLFMTRTLLL